MGGKSVYSREKYLANRHRWKSRDKEVRAKNRYGITPSQMQQLLEDQENKCAICKRPFEDKPPSGIKNKKNVHGPHIDHNHMTNKVRGLLCHWCNTGLGCFGDNKACIASAGLYLERTEG